MGIVAPHPRMLIWRYPRIDLAEYILLADCCPRIDTYR